MRSYCYWKRDLLLNKHLQSPNRRYMIKVRDCFWMISYWHLYLIALNRWPSVSRRINSISTFLCFQRLGTQPFVSAPLPLLVVKPLKKFKVHVLLRMLILLVECFVDHPNAPPPCCWLKIFKKKINLVWVAFSIASGRGQNRFMALDQTSWIHERLVYWF